MEFCIQIDYLSLKKNDSASRVGTDDSVRICGQTIFELVLVVTSLETCFLFCLLLFFFLFLGCSSCRSYDLWFILRLLNEFTFFFFLLLLLSKFRVLNIWRTLERDGVCKQMYQSLHIYHHLLYCTVLSKSAPY